MTDTVDYYTKPMEFSVSNQESKSPLDFEISNDVQQDEMALGAKSKQLRVQQLAEEFDIDQRKMMLKIDIYVLLPFFFLYFIANLNRGNFGLLWLNGVMNSLNISQLQYFGAVSAFYAPYVVCQMFSNFVLKSIRPHFYISLSVLLYGIVGLCTGFVHNYASFVACQFLHGLFQSGCDSAVYYIIANYYERSESQKRVSIMFSSFPLALITNNLIAYGIQHNIHSDYAAWRWLLFIEGPITIFGAVVLFLIVPDFPEGNRFLTNNETLFIVKKLELFTGKSGYNIPFNVKDILKNFKDPTILVAAMTANLLGGVINAYTFVEPYGYVAVELFDQQKGLIKAIWPWLASFFTIIIFGYVSDLMKIRSPIAFLSCLMMLVGTTVVRFAHIDELDHHVARDAGNFLVAMGSYSAFPEFISWASFNLSGHLRKSVITSMMISFCDLSGVYSVFGLVHGVQHASLAGFTFSVFATASMAVYLGMLRYNNKIKRTSAYKEKFEMLSEREKIVAGDKNPAFDYLY